MACNVCQECGDIAEIGKWASDDTCDACVYRLEVTPEQLERDRDAKLQRWRDAVDRIRERGYVFGGGKP